MRQHVDENAFRRIMRTFASAVTIVTVRAGDVIWGITATAVCSLSLRPPLLVVCVNSGCRTHALITRTRIFAVNLLHEGQWELAERFAGRHPESTDRFRGVPWHTVTTGAPVLNDCLGYLDCSVVVVHDGGDHSIFVGGVEAAALIGAGQPLIYYQGTYLHLLTMLQNAT